MSASGPAADKSASPAQLGVVVVLWVAGEAMPASAVPCAADAFSPIARIAGSTVPGTTSPRPLPVWIPLRFSRAQISRSD